MNYLSALIAALLPAIAQVESKSNPHAKPGDDGRALGMYQLHARAVAHVNRIDGTNYTHAQVTDPAIGRHIARRYLTICGQNYVRRTGHQPDAQTLARCYNGGLNGYRKPATIPYWNKVKCELAKRKARPCPRQQSKT
jgi:hypothetical protein